MKCTLLTYESNSFYCSEKGLRFGLKNKNSSRRNQDPPKAVFSLLKAPVGQLSIFQTL